MLQAPVPAGYHVREGCEKGPDLLVPAFPQSGLAGEEVVTISMLQVARRWHRLQVSHTTSHVLMLALKDSILATRGNMPIAESITHRKYDLNPSRISRTTLPLARVPCYAGQVLCTGH
jgi:hypothetical protein